jgi:Family of unknown function (DUF6152)
MPVSKSIRFALTVVLAMLGGASAVAHHSFAAQYDNKKPINLTGVVTSVEWTNPHVYIYVDVTDAKTKKVTNWGFEMGPPHMLQKAGWKRNSLKIGEVVEVDGWLARDGSNTANSRRVTRKSTGEVLGAATSNSQTLTSGGAAVPRSPAAP